MTNQRLIGMVAGLVLVLVLLGVGLLMLVNALAEDEDDVVTVQTEGAELESLDLGASRGSPIDPPLPLENFSLPATTGDDYVLGEETGKVKLVYFGYMTCPDFCPTTLADITRVYRALDEPQDDLSVIFVTVDPERDNLERMEAYVGAFHEDFIGLRGEDEALQAVMAQFGVVAVRREVDSALGYLVDHTASVFMVDQDNNIVYRFAYGTDPDGITEDVRALLEE